MKKTFYILVLGLSCLLTAQAQTNSPTSFQPPDTNNAAALSSGTNTVTPPPPAVVGPLDATNAPALMAGVQASTNPPVVAAVGIPQIKFSDVPITTAIENLCRLANINYMLDPKIGYGLPDANGQPKPEPMLSIRWENITAENALLALLDNYGLQLVHDKKTSIDRVTMKDPTAPPPLFTKVIQLKYASVSNMLESAQSVLSDKRSRVLTDPRTSQLIIVGTDPEQQAVETLVAQLDRPTRQVLIETRLIEISTNPRTQKGVDWSGTLQAQHVTFGNGNSQGTITTTFPGTSPGNNGANNPLPGGSSSTAGTVANAVGSSGISWNTKGGMTPNIGFLNADGLSAVLSYFNSSADAQIMSTPRIVTLDNEAATISVTRGYPIFQVSAGSANNAGGSSVSYSNVGTILHVTPRISANDYIWLRVLPEVSSFFGNFSQSVGQGSSATVLTAPVFDTRSLTTQVFIPNSNTLVMGGLVTDNPQGTYTKVPLLGDVPGLGYLFRSEDKHLNKDNLLIFITPTIVKDTDFAASTSGDFLKTKTDPLKQTMNPNTAWDSPVPQGEWIDPVTPTTK